MTIVVKKGRKRKRIGQWVAIGIALGTGIGLIFDNYPLGISLGIVFGLIIGTKLNQKTKN